MRIKSKGSILEGLPAISRYIKRSPGTVWVWIHKYGMPAMKTPKGTWMTSTALIDAWIAKQTQERLNDRTTKSTAKRRAPSTF